MAYKDTSYTFVAGSVTTTSAASGHNLYGNYNGLSNLNANEVVLLIVSASGGDLRISLDPKTGAGENTSMRIFNSASGFDLPPMSVANASQITFSRENGTNNPAMFWTAFVRVP